MEEITSMILMLQSPIAKRKGVTISAEDCKIWAEELKKGLAEMVEYCIEQNKKNSNIYERNIFKG